MDVFIKTHFIKKKQTKKTMGVYILVCMEME